MIVPPPLAGGLFLSPFSWYDGAMFQKLSQKIVYQNKWTTVFEDEIRLPDGSTSIYGYVQRPNGAGVVVLNPQNEVLMAKQFRYPIQTYEWGLVGGAIDPGETPAEAATREAFEEAGVAVSELEQLGVFYPLSSCSTELVTVFWGRTENTTPEQLRGNQADESMEEIRFIPLAKAIEMIDSGEITEALTCAVLQMVARKLA
jgi:8-oxo-dGDP phosphatase